MSVVANFFSNILKAIPVLIVKVGTVLLLIFTVGMAVGYLFAVMGTAPIIFLIPLLAMVIMWYKLDEGVFVLILLTLLVVFFPEVVNSFFSSLF
jgi:hypothetical protein